MKKLSLTALVPCAFAAATILLTAAASAAAPAPAPTPAPAPVTKPEAAPMAGHHMDTAKDSKPGDMKAECQAMMAKKQAMHDKFLAMDATLDKLVAEMNAAKTSSAPDAMEKPMAAVLNELVAQRKAAMQMMMEMQPEMMAHMMHHSGMHGMHGAMECPMMKTDAAPEPKPAQ